MPPESITALTAQTRLRNAPFFEAIPQVWRQPLGWLFVSFAILGAATAREWGEMAHQWWNIDTYNHILLVPLIAIWLIWLKSDELVRIVPRAWAPGLLFVAGALALWLAGRVTGVNLVAHAGAVGAVQGALLAASGVRVSTLLALPFAFLAFLVPFGDEIIPFLQSITAQIAIALTKWSGVPAVIDGIYIDTPVGLFIVAEECSGVKFLVAMVTLAVLVGFTRFTNWSRRALFLSGAIVLSVLANGVRAWGTIYIAQFAGVEFAAGFDHIVYGWVFFAVIVALTLAAAWPFFQCEPEDYGFTTGELEGMGWIKRFETREDSSVLVCASLAGLVVAVTVAAAILTPTSGM
ncbi:MAG: exosortase A [Pseudomonadota bacterium]